MDQPADLKILPGMAATCRARPDKPAALPEQGVEIPLSALLSEPDDKSFVWVIDASAKTVSKREVTPGAFTQRGIRLQQGLKPGEWIAIAGVHSLRQGQQVRLLDEQR